MPARASRIATRSISNGGITRGSPIHLKHLWRSIRSGKPGSRFRDHYHRERKREGPGKSQGWYIGLGIFLMVAGMILSIPPAVPGFLVTLVGAAIVSSRWHAAARAFDKAEDYGRKLLAKVWPKKKSSKG